MKLRAPQAAVWALMAACGAPGEALDAPSSGPRPQPDPTALASVRVSPASGLDFGQAVVDTAARRDLLVTNPNPRPVQVSLRGEDFGRCEGSPAPPRFCVRGLPPASGPPHIQLAAHQSVRVAFELRATAAAQRYATLVDLLVADCEGCRLPVPLSGLGVLSALTCAPERLDLGAVAPGACITGRVTCTNLANRATTVRRWTASTTPTSDESFAVDSARAFELEEGEAFDIGVRFCPRELGARSMRLDVEVDAPDPEHRRVSALVTATGIGQRVEVTPAEIDFGLVPLDVASLHTVQISNAGPGPFSVLEVRPRDGNDLSVIGAPATVLAGETRELTVAFTPRVVGPMTSSLQITTDDPSTPSAQVALRGEGVDLPPCAYTLSPPELHFGPVRVGNRTGRHVLVTNVGAHDCLLGAPRLGPITDAAFTVTDQTPGTVRLSPGESRAVRVEYAPMSEGQASASVQLALSSSLTPRPVVHVSGEGTLIGPIIGPDEVDFATRSPACGPATHEVRVHNPGPGPMLVDSARVDPTSTPFSVVSRRAIPFSLPEGETARLDVTFDPVGAGDHAAALELSSTLDGVETLARVGLRARTASTAWNEDVFAQGGTGEADVLFVVDYEPSMGSTQDAIAQQVGAVFEVARRRGVRPRIAVIDDGVRFGNHAPVFHAALTRREGYDGPLSRRFATLVSTPSPTEVLETNLLALQPHWSDPPDDAALLRATQAFGPTELLGANAGLRRPDARVGIIVLANRDDHSYPTSFRPRSELSRYIDDLTGLVGVHHADRLTISAIAGDLPDGCQSQLGGARPAPTTFEATRRTGGRFRSFCSLDWHQTLTEIAEAAFGLRRTFPLRATAIEGSVSITIDGVRIPRTNGSQRQWSYDPALRAVSFEQMSAPEPGAEVRVTYRASCE